VAVTNNRALEQSAHTTSPQHLQLCRLRRSEKPLAQTKHFGAEATGFRIGAKTNFARRRAEILPAMVLSRYSTRLKMSVIIFNSRERRDPTISIHLLNDSIHISQSRSLLATKTNDRWS